jgi:hypothetical protein
LSPNPCSCKQCFFCKIGKTNGNWPPTKRPWTKLKAKKATRSNSSWLWRACCEDTKQPECLSRVSSHHL